MEEKNELELKLFLYDHPEPGMERYFYKIL